MFIFLCAEVTAISILINYISGTELWITALIVLLATLSYTLYGGLRASIFTDNIQMVVIVIILLISISCIISFTGSEFSFAFVEKKKSTIIKRFLYSQLYCGINFFYCRCCN